MAAVAACRRVGLLGSNSVIASTGFRGGGGGFGVSKSSFPSISGCRNFSELVKSNGKRLFLVDTLALVIVIPTFPFLSLSFHCFPCLVAELQLGEVNFLFNFVILSHSVVV